MGGQPFVRPVGGLRRAGNTVRATRRGATVIVRPAFAASVLPLNVFARNSYARSSPGCDCGFIFEGVCIATIIRLLYVRGDRSRYSFRGRDRVLLAENLICSILPDFTMVSSIGLRLLYTGIVLPTCVPINYSHCPPRARYLTGTLKHPQASRRFESQR